VESVNIQSLINKLNRLKKIYFYKGFIYGVITSPDALRDSGNYESRDEILIVIKEEELIFNND
jgi:hypothetical protein